MKTFILCITVCSALFIAAIGASTQTHNSYSQKSLIQKDSITFKTFKTDSGWGYDIYINEKLYVHQPTIPAVSVNKGFSEEIYAAETAKLVTEKIRKHILPPTITPHELDSLKVLK